MSQNYSIIIHVQSEPLLTMFYWSGWKRSDVYKRDLFVTSWSLHNHPWQLQCHDRLCETSGTLWIHGGALTNQRCSSATRRGIKNLILQVKNSGRPWDKTSRQLSKRARGCHWAWHHSTYIKSKTAQEAFLILTYWVKYLENYRQDSNIRRTLVGN